MADVPLTPIKPPIWKDGTVRAVSAITVLTGVALAAFSSFGLTTGTDTTQLVLYLIGGGMGGQVAHRIAER